MLLLTHNAIVIIVIVYKHLSNIVVLSALLLLVQFHVRCSLHAHAQYFLCAHLWIVALICMVSFQGS